MQPTPAKVLSDIDSIHPNTPQDKLWFIKTDGTTIDITGFTNDYFTAFFCGNSVAAVLKKPYGNTFWLTPAEREKDAKKLQIKFEYTLIKKS